jgi:hypothetical protein
MMCISLARRHRLLGVFVGFVAGVLVMPVGIASAETGPSANGHANLVINGEKETFSFQAREQPDGSDVGTFQVKSRGQDLLQHGVIDCLRVEGNVATASGMITKEKEPVFGGPFVLFTLVDHGEGEDAPPDIWSDVYVFDFPVSCDRLREPPNNPVLEGNFQVKP